MLRFAFGSAVVLLLAAACSSDDSGSGGAGGPFEPAGNGVAMDEGPACQAVLDALQDRELALACGAVTRPPCPTFLSKGKEACLKYDQGTVTGCVAFYASLPSCKELSTRPCVVKELPGSAPTGCPSSTDAGPDVVEDTGVDAGTDAADDVSVDVAIDVEIDAALDAPIEVGND